MMKRLIFTIPVAAIVLLTLVGCNNAQQPTSQNPTVTETTGTTSAQGGFDALANVILNTKAAVETGDFNQATQEFDKFESAWVKVEDGVKTKSSKTYGVIEDAATQVKSALKAKDKAKAQEGLNILNTNITAVSKS